LCGIHKSKIVTLLNAIFMIMIFVVEILFTEVDKASLPLPVSASNSDH